MEGDQATLCMERWAGEPQKTLTGIRKASCNIQRLLVKSFEIETFLGYSQVALQGWLALFTIKTLEEEIMQLELTIPHSWEQFLFYGLPPSARKILDLSILFFHLLVFVYLFAVSLTWLPNKTEARRSSDSYNWKFLIFPATTLYIISEFHCVRLSETR